MSWSRRATLLAAVAAAGCGFSPALAPDGAAGGLRGEIEVAAPNNVWGYALRRRLEERLGMPASPAYTLRASVSTGTQVTGIPADRVEARRNLVGQVDYTLVEKGTGNVVRSGRVQSFTGYSTTSTTAATRAASVDAQERLMVILADRIVADLLATAEEWRG